MRSAVTFSSVGYRNEFTKTTRATKADQGVATVVNADANAVQVPQFQAPLFDDQEFDELTNNKSEFDLSSLIEDVTDTFGIPAFSEQLYYVFARPPDNWSDEPIPEWHHQFRTASG